MPRSDKYNIEVCIRNIRLTKSFLEEHGTIVTTCDHCGRWLTDKEFAEHKKTKSD